MDQANSNFINLLLRFIEAAGREYPVRFAYLFGSRARGEETSGSDIDIAVCFVNHYDKTETAFIRGHLIDLGKKFFNVPLDIVSLEHADLFLKYTIVKEGIRIKNSSDSSQTKFESLTLREYFDFQYYSHQYNASMIDAIKKQNYFGDANGR